MKKIIILLISFLLLISFSACGGSSDSTPIAQEMVIGQVYTLDIGDEINKITLDAIVEISQNSENNETTYTLLVGEAEIVR